MQKTNKRTYKQREQVYDELSSLKINFKTSPDRSSSQKKKASNFKRDYTKEELDSMYEKKVIEVKNKYEKAMKSSSNHEIISKIYKELKRCEKCFDFVNQNSMMLCTYCEDAYHCYCVDFTGRSRKKEEFVCDPCEVNLDNEETIQTQLKGISKTIKKVEKVK
jgi:hypothetical protein